MLEQPGRGQLESEILAQPFLNSDEVLNVGLAAKRRIERVAKRRRRRPMPGRSRPRRVSRSSIVSDTRSPKDGSVALVELNSTPIRDGDKIIGAQASARDITKRRHVENALRESEEKFRTIFNHAQIGILISSIEGFAILQANTKFCSIFGIVDGKFYVGDQVFVAHICLLIGLVYSNHRIFVLFCQFAISPVAAVLS